MRKHAGFDHHVRVSWSSCKAATPLSFVIEILTAKDQSKLATCWVPGRQVE